MHAIKMKGQPLKLSGSLPKVGEPAPDFTAAANDMSAVRLADIKGKVIVICSVPSLDTPVCDAEARRFNTEAIGLGDDVAVVVVSMDLPFAQKRWCGAAGIENIQTLSDHNQASFGSAYGVLIEALRLLARAVFVLDKQGIIRYTELVEEVTHEPDYEAALEAVRQVER